MFVLAIIAALLALAAFALARAGRKYHAQEMAEYEAKLAAYKDRKQSTGYIGYAPDKPEGGGAVMADVSKIAGLVLAGVMVVLLFFACAYTQDVGQSFVLKDWTGNLVGERAQSGMAFKAPWVDTIEFDTRNQLVAYIGDGSTTYNGQKATGPEITVTDNEGVTANIDVAVVYSINPDAVKDIYTQYKTQDNFRAKLIEQDVRSIVRDVPAQYGTLDMLTKRAEVAAKIKSALSDQWTPKGIVVEDVALQDIRYSDQVKQRFDQAQQARIDVTTEQAKLDAAKVSAQQQVVQAQAAAQANQILEQSLTPNVLQQHYLDTLGKLAQAGNLVITDGSNGTMINIPKKN